MNSSTKKTVYVIRYGDLPCQKNRAVYQRPLYLSKYYDVWYVTSKNSSICEAIKTRSEIYEVPFSAMRNWMGILGVTVWRVFAAIYLACFISRKKSAVIYTFHRDGFLAGGLCKILFPNKVRLICDMQHTPYYYLDAARHSKFSPIKKTVYAILGYMHIMLAKAVLPKADLVCVMSLDYGEGFAKILEEKFKVRKDRLLPIPNGTDLSLLHNNDVEPVMQLDHVPKKYLYAGNIQRERLLQILNIYKAVCLEEADSVLMLCGKITPEAKKLLNLEVNTTNKIRYLGVIDHSDLMRLYGEVDVVLVAIDTERRDHEYSHPGKLFEAMACRKVVVSSDFHLATKIIQHGVNGFIFSKDATQSDIKEVVCAIDDSERANEIGNKAYETASKFDWKILNEVWAARIENLL